MSIHLYYDLQYVTDDGKCINKYNISYSEIMNFPVGFDGHITKKYYKDNTKKRIEIIFLYTSDCPDDDAESFIGNYEFFPKMYGLNVFTEEDKNIIRRFNK